MARLKAKQRKALPKSDFGLPGQRKYPMPNRAHAIDAKGRAKQQLNKGHLSEAAYRHIVNMANRKLG